jgi:hypothetical protein
MVLFEEESALMPHSLSVTSLLTKTFSEEEEIMMPRELAVMLLPDKKLTVEEERRPMP